MDIDQFLLDIKKIDWLNSANPIRSVLESDYDWEWLPTSKDQVDPFHSSGQTIRNSRTKESIRAVYKTTLRSLCSIDDNHPKLQDGPHNFTEAFKGAALFATRHAAIEHLTDAQKKWTKILDWYKKGRWPCGVKKDGSLVLM